MKWKTLLETVGTEPVFSSSLLLTPGESQKNLHKQLSRWRDDHQVIQLRRGLYTLSPPYQKTEPALFLVANRMKAASYVSLQSALSYYGMIPEYVPQITSVTTGRPEKVENSLGRFSYRHISPALFFGYHHIEIIPGQKAFVAKPEKALLDLIYLTTKGGQKEYLEQLRLQNLEIIDPRQLEGFAHRSKKPKLKRAAGIIKDIMHSEEYETL
jgi:predicted transcriptional regulator of viral defense system